MIALLITDTHLKESNIELVQDIWKQAVEVCLERDIKRIFFLGDFFDSRKGQPLTTLKTAQKVINMIEEAGIQVYAIAGNHDKASYDSEASFIDIFNSASFQVYDEYGVLDIGDLKIHFLSYFSEKTESYTKRLEEIKADTNKGNFLMTHVGINGSISNDNEHIDNCIPSKKFSNFDTVFVGHFHDQHEFENITYIGSAYQANFGEDDKKGFMILHEGGTYEFVKSKFPKYIKQQVDISELNDFMLDSDFLSETEGNHARIELVGSSEELKSFDRSILTDIGIEPVLKPREAIISLDEANTTTYDKKSIKEAFTAFCKENEVEPNEYAVKKLEEI